MKKTNSLKLERKLGFIDIFALAAGAMISSGLFILPGIAFAKSGPAVIVAYLLASLLMLPTMFAQVELVTAMPKAGGTYFFIERSLGPLAGILSGLANWFSISLKTAFALVGIGAFLVLIKPDASTFEIKLIAVSATVLFAAVNIISVEKAGKFQIFLVLFLLIILNYYIIGGLNRIKVLNFSPFMPFGKISILKTAGLVFISFGGLTKVASLGEEVKNPGKNIPIGMFSAFLIVSAIYIAVIFVTVGIVDKEILKNSLVPLSLGGKILGGTFGEITLSIAAMLAFITTANAGIMSASRAPFAMSRDKLLPPVFGKVNSKTDTPVFSIIITSAFIISVITLLDIESLVKTASALMLLLFIFVNIAIIIMRESKIQSYRPTFKAIGYPLLQIFSIVIYSFLIVEMGKAPLLISLLLVATGMLWYYIFLQKKVKIQSALIHIVERITDKKIVDDSLTNELNDILLERDNIIEDRFDKIIRKSIIIDMHKLIDYKDFFKYISKKIASKVSLSETQMYRLLMNREKESSTVIKPGLAIPHIIIPGKNKFYIVLVRNKEGIRFPGTDTLVKTVFILLGTKDERNFHLRALMAIAQIAQEENFSTLWLNAKNTNELRSIILLSNRQRDS